MSATKTIDSTGMVSGFGKYHTNEPEPGNPRKTLTPYVTVTWEEIQAKVDNPSSIPKEQAQWVIPSTLLSRNKKKQEVEGQYLMLWADFDTDPKPISDVGFSLEFEVLEFDVNFEQYSSRSATAAVQKSRALVPLVNPLGGEDWLICQRIFNQRLRQCNLTPDTTTERHNQICYLPNKGEFYETHSKRDGVPFDPLRAWSSQIAAIRDERAAEVEAERKLSEQRAEAKRRREATRLQSGTGDQSLIKAFNQVYTPQDFLSEEGYDQRGDSFRHPASQSGSYSASVKEGPDGVLRVHSLSSSDPLYTGGGGGGAHDAFSTFTVLRHGHGEEFKAAAIKDAGDNYLKIGEEPWNVVKRREYMRNRATTATEDFANLDGEKVDTETGEISPKLHPLARFLDISEQPTAPEWVLPGFIGPGVVTFAGAHGVGKTTVLLPLAMAAAGLHSWNYPLAPKHWRHVVYITEDTAQANRIVAGMLSSSDFGNPNAFLDSSDIPDRLDPVIVRERLHLVEARRMDVEYVAGVGAVYREKFCRSVNGVSILPLVVVDTKAAVLAMDDENSNSENSRIVNVLKQGFCGLPVWLVGHIAKQNIGRSDLLSLSMRGGSAIEADANQTLYLVKEGTEGSERRYLVRGKTRFEANWSELEITSYTTHTMARDVFGDEESVTLRWAIATPGLQTRAQAKAVDLETSKSENDHFTSIEIIDAVRQAYEDNTPLNRASLKGKVNRKAESVIRCVDKLLADGRLYEVEVPKSMRVHPKKSSYLLVLTDDEQAQFKKTGTIPALKLEIPPSWKREPVKSISSVPGVETDLAIVLG